jgi:hypothetical protein
MHYSNFPDPSHLSLDLPSLFGSISPFLVVTSCAFVTYFRKVHLEFSFCHNHCHPLACCSNPKCHQSHWRRPCSGRVWREVPQPYGASFYLHLGTLDDFEGHKVIFRAESQMIVVNPELWGLLEPISPIYNRGRQHLFFISTPFP